eukprot:TRINITY_DN4437_c0_g1_i1.p1 TRINITY_DN4437_c0_g1~~TRINITY_DN4437_c0_g1_i1.p1  ORF type:complete len:182 (+),score=27.05 TRINITY_DN4437_c0_g1_i1:47-592(+)
MKRCGGRRLVGLVAILSLALGFAFCFSYSQAAEEGDMPTLPIDFKATYELVGDNIPKGTKAIVYNLLSKKKMRVDTSDPTGVVVTYFMFFNNPEGRTTTYTTYLTSCKKDSLEYREGEELYLIPGHGPGCEAPAYLGLSKVNGKLTKMWERICPVGRYQLYFDGNTLLRSLRTPPDVCEHT